MLHRIIDPVLFEEGQYITKYETKPSYIYWLQIENPDTLTTEECYKNPTKCPYKVRNLGEGGYLVHITERLNNNDIVLI